jgi:hypothetical protein
MNMVTGYCMKCRAKRTMVSAKTTTKKGRKVTKGKCAKCGTKMAKLGG